MDDAVGDSTAAAVVTGAMDPDGDGPTEGVGVTAVPHAATM